LPPSGLEPAHQVIAAVAHALGQGPKQLSLSEIRATIDRDARELAPGTVRLARIALPNLVERPVLWGTQLGPSSDQSGGVQSGYLESSLDQSSQDQSSQDQSIGKVRFEKNRGASL